MEMRFDFVINCESQGYLVDVVPVWPLFVGVSNSPHVQLCPIVYIYAELSHSISNWDSRQLFIFSFRIGIELWKLYEVEVEVKILFSLDSAIT